MSMCDLQSLRDGYQNEEIRGKQGRLCVSNLIGKVSFCLPKCL